MAFNCTFNVKILKRTNTLERSCFALQHFRTPFAALAGLSNNRFATCHVNADTQQLAL